MERKDGKSYPLRESSPRERKEKESERSIFEERERRKGNCANFKKETKKKKKGGLAGAKLQNIELTTIISPTISVFQDR